MKQRSAQAIVLYAMDLEAHHGQFPIESAREAFVQEEPWQPVQRFLQRLSARRDWGEVIVAANLCFEPLVGTLLRRELGIRAAASNGDTVSPVLAGAATQEWEWTRRWTVEFVQFLLDDTRFGGVNRSVIVGWVDDWLPRAEEAALALAPLAGTVGIDVGPALADARRAAYELPEASRHEATAQPATLARWSCPLASHQLARTAPTTTSGSSWPRAPRATPSPASWGGETA